MLENTRILVIGDIMLDQYVFGAIDRFCPSAYVPVLRKTNEKLSIGGAANVFNNIRAFTKHCDLCGIIGDDESGKHIYNLLEKLENRMEFIFKISSYKTITKSYYKADNNQLLLRVDTEEHVSLSEIEYTKIYKLIAERIRNYSVVVLSDYNKNFLTNNFIADIVKLCNECNIKVLVDTKRNDILPFLDSYLIKPNKNELQGYFSDATVQTTNDIIKYANKVMNTISCNYVLVTNGGDDIVLIDEDRVVYVDQPENIMAVDTNGAGDTFMAVIAYYTFLNTSIHEAIKKAKYFASRVCEKHGTVTLSENIINSKLKEKKVINLEELEILAPLYKEEKKKITFVNGCFDIIHAGHIELFRQARLQGDVLFVGINSDDSIINNRGNKKPIINENHRLNVIQSIQYVDHVIIFHENDPRKLIEIIQPNVVVKGEDYKGKRIIEQDCIEKYGGEVLYLNNSYDISTTKIIERITVRYND